MADTSHYAHCRTLLAKFKRNHIWRLAVLAGILVLNFYVHVLTFGVKYGGPSFEEAKALERGVSMLPFGMGMATLICSIVALVLAVFAEVKRPKLLFILMGLILLCAFADFIHWLLAGIILVVFATQIKDVMNYRWVKEQPGWPHFSERLDEQLENREYKPVYDAESDRYAAMASAKEKEGEYVLQTGSDPNEMPGVSEVPLDEPVPDAKLPEVPELNIPDPITDTSVIVSDPMADFPDLPDIPDIPKL